MPTRRPKTDQQALVIRNRVDEGRKVREIAAELQVSQARVRYVAQLYKIPVAPARTMRFGFWASRAHGVIVVKLAEEAGVSPSTMCHRLIEAMVGDGFDAAKRRLGKLAIPPRERKPKEIAIPDPGPSKRDLQKQAREKRQAEAKETAAREREAIARVMSRRAAE